MMTKDTPDDNSLGLPYTAKSRQETGRVTERAIAKAMGARVHPMSGAGSIKWDASTDELLVEIKDANKTHTVNGAYLASLYRDATRAGKQPRYVVYFTDADITVTCAIQKGKA